MRKFHPDTTMEAESRLNTAFDLEREWWDKKSQTMIYAKASKKGMIDYIDNLNRFLHEGTGDKTHATKIGTELLSIQASTAEESSPESIQFTIGYPEAKDVERIRFPNRRRKCCTSWDAD